jgi:cytoskeletal protein RodZ
MKRETRNLLIDLVAGVCILIALALVLSGCCVWFQPEPTPPATATVEVPTPTATEEVTEPTPTATEMHTSTPSPTNTPRPTATMTKAPTPTVEVPDPTEPAPTARLEKPESRRQWAADREACQRKGVKCKPGYWLWSKPAIR